MGEATHEELARVGVDPAAAVVVHPGDMLVINLGDGCTVERARATGDALEAAFPDFADRILVVMAADIAAVRSGTPPAAP